MSGPGRGGPRTAGPGKTMGRPPKAESERTVQRGPYRFPPDVVQILDKQRNATEFICESVRGGGDLELEVSIVYCKCGLDYVTVNSEEKCPNGCAAGGSRIGKPTSLTIQRRTK